MLRTALELLEFIEKIQGTLEKKRIMANGNQVFQSLLKYAYNPFVTYGIKKIPDVKPMGLSNNRHYLSFTRLLRNLSMRTWTGNRAIQEVSLILGMLSEIEFKWFCRVIDRDLNIGIQATTINDVFPNLIPTFDIMLANKFTKYPQSFMLQPKLDGLRVLVNTTTGELRTRNGKLLEGFTEIEDAIQLFPEGYWLDGEMVVSGDFNKTMRDAFRKISGKLGILNVFDAIPLEDFYRKQCSLLYFQRMELLLKLFNQYLDNITYAGKFMVDSPIKRLLSSGIMSSSVPGTMEKVERYYERQLELGYEGIMVKDAFGLYTFKRSSEWQKLKPTDNFDIVVSGIERGDRGTKYEDAVGRLVCEFEGQEVRVGSGLSDIQRQVWIKRPNVIVGKVIEVEAQEITNNTQGTHSLRFPVFKRIRCDKSK